MLTAVSFLLPLLPLTLAAPAPAGTASFKPFQISELTSFSPSGRPGSSPYSTLNLTVTDVNRNGKATTKCSTQFLPSEQPPQGDTACADPSFVFRATDYQSTGQFKLVLSHTYPLKPEGRITTEGAVTVDNTAKHPNYYCSYAASGFVSCGIAEGKAPLKAPITSVSAVA